MPSRFTVRPLGPAIGAEAMDLDLTEARLPETLAAIAAALVKHEALVLHVPELTPSQHLAIAEHFGEPEVHTFFPNLGAGFEQITIIDSKLGDRADMWHHDESFLPSPPIVTMTQAKMERIPRNDWDTDAGFRGYCTKFEFICHDLRVCQAWDEREFDMED